MRFQYPSRVQGSRRLRDEKYRCDPCVHFVAFTPQAAQALVVRSYFFLTKMCK